MVPEVSVPVPVAVQSVPPSHRSTPSSLLYMAEPLESPSEYRTRGFLKLRKTAAPNDVVSELVHNRRVL